MDKICKYHTNKNSFVYFKQKGNLNDTVLIDIYLEQLIMCYLINYFFGQKDVIKISFGQNKNDFAYFTAQQQRIESEESIYINNIYAKKLKLNEGHLIRVEHVYRDCLFANSITIGKYKLLVLISLHRVRIITLNVIMWSY